MAELLAVQLGYDIAVMGVLKSIKELKDKTISFKRKLQHLESTLTSVLPRLEKIRDSNVEITGTFKAEMERLIAELNGAKELVLDYTHLGKRHLAKKMGKKGKISKVLSNVDESVVRFFQLNVQMEIWEKTMGIEAHAERVESLPGNADRKMKKSVTVEVTAVLVEETV